VLLIYTATSNKNIAVIAAWKRCSVRLYLQLFVGGIISYLRYLCLFGYSGVQHILCCIFALLYPNKLTLHKVNFTSDSSNCFRIWTFSGKYHTCVYEKGDDSHLLSIFLSWMVTLLWPNRMVFTFLSCFFLHVFVMFCKPSESNPPSSLVATHGKHVASFILPSKTSKEVMWAYYLYPDPTYWWKFQ
jgi:hypothetical protein